MVGRSALLWWIYRWYRRSIAIWPVKYVRSPDVRRSEKRSCTWYYSGRRNVCNEAWRAGLSGDTVAVRYWEWALSYDIRREPLIRHLSHATVAFLRVCVAVCIWSWALGHVWFGIVEISRVPKHTYLVGTLPKLPTLNVGKTIDNEFWRRGLNRCITVG